MDATFIRRDFYIKPPSADASPAEWKAWQKKDDRKAAAHKAQYTKSFQQQDAPEEFQSDAMMIKDGGVWRQSTAIGFSGDFESGQGNLERPVEASQEHHIALVSMETKRNRRGGNNRAGKSARRRANRKRRKNI